MLVELFAIFLVVLWMWDRQKTARARKMIEKFPGPKAFPIIGTIKSIRGTSVEFFQRLLNTNAKYASKGQPFRVIIGSMAVVILNDPKDFEIILGSQKHIEKGGFYKYFLPWIGTGLLTSSGPKWRHHRKLLTPAFHFKILEDFVDVFNENADILVQKLKENVNGPGFDIYKYMTLCAVDNVCEGAMGVKMNTQNSSASEYVKAIKNQNSVILNRSLGKPWLRLDFIFNMTHLKTLHEESLEILHRSTKNVIKARRAVFEKERKEKQQKGNPHDEKEKKRLALLDILLEAAHNDSGMTDEEIREEVDTFMLAGHGTTSSTVSFALWLLSWHQDIQEQLWKELQEMFPDSNESPKYRQLQELKYLERVIKETLRIYPSVPLIARQVTEDVTLSGGLVIPEGTIVNISIMSSQTNPTFWPDPLKFDPDRFTPENIQGRHPYAYIPFSAGPRNCIGQKFGMLEVKSTLAQILRAYKIFPGCNEPNLRLTQESALFSANGIPIRLEHRGNVREMDTN